VKRATVYLGLGSNLEDRQGNLQFALEFLSHKSKIEKVSPVYDTAPVGNVNQPRFLNLACLIKTELSPSNLLAFIKGIEKKIGRKPGPKDSPRPIDIDILFYDNLVLETDKLIIPHPRLSERAFVLAPLADIAPGLKHPVSKKSVIQMLTELQRTKGDAIVTKIKVQLATAK
jgi:2-amino-4-hydroxy-6-hydroxymethyldihydropteridine diphosphokinase